MLVSFAGGSAQFENEAVAPWAPDTDVTLGLRLSTELEQDERWWAAEKNSDSLHFLQRLAQVGRGLDWKETGLSKDFKLVGFFIFVCFMASGNQMGSINFTNNA